METIQKKEERNAIASIRASITKYDTVFISLVITAAVVIVLSIMS